MTQLASLLLLQKTKCHIISSEKISRHIFSEDIMRHWILRKNNEALLFCSEKIMRLFFLKKRRLQDS